MESTVEECLADRHSERGVRDRRLDRMSAPGRRASAVDTERIDGCPLAEAPCRGVTINMRRLPAVRRWTSSVSPPGGGGPVVDAVRVSRVGEAAGSRLSSGHRRRRRALLALESRRRRLHEVRPFKQRSTVAQPVNDEERDNVKCSSRRTQQSGTPTPPQ